MKRTLLIGWFAMAAGLGGCSPYALEGRVVIGAKSLIQVVEADDPRLAGPAIDGASIEFVLDPDSGGSEVLGTTQTQPNGSFRFPVDAPGAGFLEYDLLVIARAADRTPAMTTLPMPDRTKRLLITLAPGRDGVPRVTDPLRDSMEDAERWMR